MDLSNFIRVTPATAENHHTSNCTNTIDFDEGLQNMLSMDLSEFDFSLFDIPLPPSSLPPIGPVPAPAQLPQLPSYCEVSDNVNLIGRNSAQASCGGNGRGGSLLGHRHDSNRFCFGRRGSSAPSSYRKRTVIPPEKLAELQIADPIKAQRIISNRVAAKKSKEKKRNYEKELTKKVELLQITADNVTEERVTAMNEVMQLAVERKRIKDLIESTLQHQQRQRAVIELMKQEANTLKRQIHDMNTTMADLSFGKPVSQSQPQLPNQPELYVPSQMPLAPPPPSTFGEPLLPPPPSSFCKPLLTPRSYSSGEPLVPPPLSSFGELLVLPPPSPFGVPFGDHFIGNSFLNCNLWN